MRPGDVLYNLLSQGSMVRMEMIKWSQQPRDVVCQGHRIFNRVVKRLNHDVSIGPEMQQLLFDHDDPRELATHMKKA